MPPLDALPDRPCLIPDFTQGDDILVLALPDAVLAAGTPDLALRRSPDSDGVDLVVTPRRGHRPYILRLPGLLHLRASDIALISLSDSEALLAARARGADAALTGDGHYPQAYATRAAHTAGPQEMVFDHRHDWRRDGPPPEQFFDLSHPDSQLSVTLGAETGGPVYAIRLTEQSGTNGVRDIQASIVLVQTAPNSPRLSAGELARRFAEGISAPDFRAIAWIWLGNEGHFTDPRTGKRTRFGGINQSPGLSITGPIAGSVEIRR